MYGYQWPKSRQVRLPKARVQRPRPPIAVIAIQNSEGDMLPPPPPIPKTLCENPVEKVDEITMSFLDALTDRICGLPQALSKGQHKVLQEVHTTECETASYDAVTMEDECVSQDDETRRTRENK